MTPTEINIIESAKKLFIQKGYRATSMREIASDAQVNLAMLNYYFRSKENLFGIIFDEAFDSMSSNIIPAITYKGNSFEIIERFIHAYIDGLINNPSIPGFIFQEVLSNPERLTLQIQKKDPLRDALIEFVVQLKEDEAKGVARAIENPINMFLDIVSLCAFPFIAKPIVELITEIDNDKYMQLMEKRKSEVTEIIHCYLKA